MFGYKMTPETLPDMPPIIPSTRHFPLHPPIAAAPPVQRLETDKLMQMDDRDPGIAIA